MNEGDKSIIATIKPNSRGLDIDTSSFTKPKTIGDINRSIGEANKRIAKYMEEGYKRLPEIGPIGSEEER